MSSSRAPSQRLAVQGRHVPYGIANATVGEVYAYGGKLISEAEAQRREAAREKVGEDELADHFNAEHGLTE